MDFKIWVINLTGGYLARLCSTHVMHCEKKLYSCWMCSVGWNGQPWCPLGPSCTTRRACTQKHESSINPCCCIILLCKSCCFAYYEAMRGQNNLYPDNVMWNIPIIGLKGQTCFYYKMRLVPLWPYVKILKYMSQQKTGLDHQSLSPPGMNHRPLLRAVDL